MAEVIRTYHESELGYYKLDMFAKSCNSILQCMANNIGLARHYTICIENTYFDMSQDWWYTSPITYNGSTKHGWQSLCPRDYKVLLESDSFEKIHKYAMAYVDYLLGTGDDDRELDFSKIV